MEKEKNCAIKRVRKKENNDEEILYRVMKIDYEALEILPIKNAEFQSLVEVKKYIKNMQKEGTIDELVSYDQLKCQLLKMRKDKMREKN